MQWAGVGAVEGPSFSLSRSRPEEKGARPRPQQEGAASAEEDEEIDSAVGRGGRAGKPSGVEDTRGEGSFERGRGRNFEGDFLFSFGAEFCGREWGRKLFLPPFSGGRRRLSELLC